MTPSPGAPALDVDGPKHERVARAIEAAIRSGDISPGAQLLGEKALAARFGVSRGTVRRALEELASRDLIATRTGRGSFVTFDGHDVDTSEGWSQALSSAGAALTTELLRLEAVRDTTLATALALSDPKMLAVDRVRRLADGQVVSLERSRLPLVPGLAAVPETGLVGGSITATIAAAGLQPTHGEQWGQVTTLDEGLAEIFGRPTGSPYLHTVRLSRDATGRVVEHVTSTLDPAHFRLHLRF